jgi:UDP-N-acetylglucosamine 3-dehydrogenase
MGDMEVKKRFVVVGAGSIGKRHARLLNERDDIETEIVEPNAEALQIALEEVGDVRTHSSFDEMLQTKPDMVLIATPHTLHCGQTVAALEAGADVLCEKPMSDSLDDAKKMKETADRTGKVLDIGFSQHFNPPMMRLKQIINDGTLGKVIHLHARIGTYYTLMCSKSRYQAHHEGALIFDYAHQPDSFYWMLGTAPKRVYAAGMQAGDLKLSANPNVVSMICEYDSPLMTTIHLNYVQYPQRAEYEAVGDKASVIADLCTGKIRIYKIGSDEIIEEDVSPERDNLYRDEHQAFIDAVDGKRGPETSAAAGVVSTAVCQAVLDSWKSGRPVDVQL